MSIITKQDLENAQKNAKSWDKYWHGTDAEDVITYLNMRYPTHAKALKALMDNGGLRPFATEAELLAYVPTVPTMAAKALDTKKVWLWKNGAWVDTGLSELDKAKNYVDPYIDQIARQDSTFYYAPNVNKVVKDSNSALFAIEISVKEKEVYSLKTQPFGVVGAFYIADANENVLSYMTASETLAQFYLIEIPANASKLYVNCTYDYAENFSLTKIPAGILELLYIDKDRKQFTSYYSPNGSTINQLANKGLFSKVFTVVENDYFEIETETFGVVGRYYIVDVNGNILAKMLANEGESKPYIIKMPKNSAKLYVNCAYSYIDNFSAKKLTKTDGLRQDNTFYYAPTDNLIKQESNMGLFAVEMNVLANDNYSIRTGSFGVAAEIFITDANGVVLLTKAATDALSSEYIITIPVNASKLYVNCKYAYADSFSVKKVSNAILERIPKVDQSVRSVFPTFNYFDQLRLKCPNFYQKFKDKMQDVVVVLTGTSLTQGNFEYTTLRTDASSRPAALQAHDFASLVFDKLAKHWDGQKYRRYDHSDLTYSNSSWSVVNQLPEYVWDDFAHIKNGLTKTTTDANTSVSMLIPANAWQFNFVYRSDSQSGNCTVSIAEGNSKVEVWNGVNWVEANDFVFSMYESPATETKGNTQYQKRLKMRCKNKVSGGINSIGSTKQITISKGNNSNRFNVVGFEWSPREFMLSVINGARGGFEWGDPNGNRLDRYQDTDIWSFNPDLLLSEITIINWGASDVAALNKDPLHYVNNAKRAYFNEFNDMPTSLYEKSEGYTKCDVIFYSDTLSAHSSLDTWDLVTKEPKFGTVTEAAKNGQQTEDGPVLDLVNIGRVKTNFENYEAVERYIAGKDYLFISVLSTFKAVAELFYGSYHAAMQPSGKNGSTLSYDGVHFNDNGAALFALIVASIFDGI